MGQNSNCTIQTRRIHEPARSDDGARILVDRLWPRGIRKADARLDHWLRALAPSNELRKWFGHDPSRWDDFRAAYLKELRDADPEALDTLRQCLRESDTVTLLFASRETELNNAVALKGFLDEGELC